MAVQEIGVPTGFEADVESIGQISGVKKVEQENRKVILYFDEVSCIIASIYIHVIPLKYWNLLRNLAYMYRYADLQEPDYIAVRFNKYHIH